MSFLRSLTSVLGAPLVERLEARAKETVDATIDAHDLAHTGSLRELGAHLVHARAALDELHEELNRCRAAFQALQDRRSAAPDQPAHRGVDVALRLAGAGATAEALAEQVDLVARGLHEVGDRLVAGRAGVESAEQRTLHVDAQVQRVSQLAAALDARLGSLMPTLPPSPPPAAGAAPKHCLIPGCEGNHRAKGMCGKHYQMWKRGKLPGVVLEDGQLWLTAEGPPLQLDRQLSGTIAVQTEAGWTVAGQRVS